MVARKHDGIILLSSLSGMQGTPLVGNYAATKAWNRILGEGLWWELRSERRGRARACVAGATDTPGFRASAPKPGMDGNVPVQSAEVVATEVLPALRRRPSFIAGRPEEPLRGHIALPLAPPPRRCQVDGHTMNNMYGSTSDVRWGGMNLNATVSLTCLLVLASACGVLSSSTRERDAESATLLALADSLSVEAGGKPCDVPDSLSSWPDHPVRLSCDFADPVRGTLGVLIREQRIMQVHRQWHDADSTVVLATAARIADNLLAWGAWPTTDSAALPPRRPPGLWYLPGATIILAVNKPISVQHLVDTTWTLVLQANPTSAWAR